MKIGIDARVLDRKVTGTSRYLLNLLTEIPAQDAHNEYFLFSTRKHEINNNFYKSIVTSDSKIPFKIYSPFWLNRDIPMLVKKYGIDLLFSPNVIIPLVDLGKCKTVSVVHDVIFKVYKEYYPFLYRQYLSFFLRLSLRKSNKIVTVSELSKNDIIKYYNLPSEKIEVVYNTASKRFYPRSLSELERNKILSKYSLPEKFLLYVGVVEKRKNVSGLIKVMDALEKKGSKIKLVVVGKPGYKSDSILEEFNKRNKTIIYFQYLEDDDLAYIYNLAFAFIFPSFYEGFGIPPLEAMQSAIPVLSSNAPALVEVVGEGGLIHNPSDYTGFMNDILKLEMDDKFYLLMKSKALEQSKKFSLKETTKKLVSIFNEYNEI
ncbi:MAG: glycosyltransferase family 1 protein [Stygiobacter sp.]|nr:MAG: glycosyltransferase family 1 protein [Stygiobacter sp.]